MSIPGDAELIAARSALLDALEVLEAHQSAVVVVGAQAVYLRTGEAAVALAEATKDSDLALDARLLNDAPLIGQLLREAGYQINPENPNPGAWLNPDGVPVDIMVPEALSGPAARRKARIPPHEDEVARRTVGIEAAVVDHGPMLIRALGPADGREFEAEVAGSAALLVAKLHKLGDRQRQSDRLFDKDAHDLYRLLVATTTDELAMTMVGLRAHPVAGDVTGRAVELLEELFATPESDGSVMAGRAEELVGDPEVVSAAVSALATDLLAAL
jgi:hypothetical protein